MPPSLAEEIGKRHPFGLPEQEAALNVLRTAAALNEPFERLFHAHGLSGPLYNVLRIVRGAGAAGAPSGEIGPQMITPAPDVTRLVDRLESLGLAERRRGEDDRRVVRVRLAAKGRRLLEKLDPLVERLHRDTLGHMSPAELRRLSELTVRARAFLRGAPLPQRRSRPAGAGSP